MRRMVYITEPRDILRHCQRCAHQRRRRGQESNIRPLPSGTPMSSLSLLLSAFAPMTKRETGCTTDDPNKGLTDRIVRAGTKDDGTSLVTKSSKTAFAVCGRLGDGRPMPVYTVFNSGDSFEPSWTPSIVSDCIFDKDGKGLPWRYSSNEKGSVNEDYCREYIEEILWPSLGYPKPRDSHLGQQGVVTCDGVGTHLAYSVVKRAIELGLEIVLRVPHLTWVLQGKYTVNFKVFFLQYFM